MIYAATEPGVEELRRLIQRVRDCVQEVEEASRAVENTQIDTRPALCGTGRSSAGDPRGADPGVGAGGGRSAAAGARCDEV